MDNHWAVTTSSGRRVSLLCEDHNDNPFSYASSSSPTPPMSPDYRRSRPHSLDSASSSTSSLNTVSSHGLYSPKTPPNMSLPPLEELLPVHETSYFPSFSTKGVVPSINTSPALAPLMVCDDSSVSPTTTTTTSSLQPQTAPPSPKSGPSPPNTSNNPPPPPIKRTSRRYACQCGKSFTTSGHLARHTRIHTGEKNYVCPETGCGARFSRQDNCMQHYRTHQSGSTNKRAARKRRMSTECIVAGARQEPIIPPEVAFHHHHRAHSHSCHQPQPLPCKQFSGPSSSFCEDGGLTALANVAISGFP